MWCSMPIYADMHMHMCATLPVLLPTQTLECFTDFLCSLFFFVFVNDQQKLTKNL